MCAIISDSHLQIESLRKPIHPLARLLLDILHLIINNLLLLILIGLKSIIKIIDNLMPFILLLQLIELLIRVQLILDIQLLLLVLDSLLNLFECRARCCGRRLF